MGRLNTCCAAVIFDFNCFEHFDDLTRGILFLDADTIDQEVERCGTAIHNRNFVGIDIDQNVINARSGKGSHQMFDGADLDATGSVAQTGAQAGVDHAIVTCREQRLVIQIRAAKYDAMINRGRVQCDADLVTGMQTDARTADGRFKRALTHVIVTRDACLRDGSTKVGDVVHRNPQIRSVRLQSILVEVIGRAVTLTSLASDTTEVVKITQITLCYAL